MVSMEHDDQKIAVIGMACRLPGADNIHEFWQNLENGVESISTFTDEELREAGVDEKWIKSPNYVRRRGIINGAEQFDASFFGFTPRDAEIMDPQHRVFLECAWHAMEDAGYNPEETEARVGVFGGTGTNWHLNSTKNNSAVRKYASGTSIVTGNDKDYLATRVSYKLNLTGPSLTVQSACSTSLSAVVLGISSLLSYQSDMVLAGGSTIELPEKQGYMYQEGGLESSDGVCRTFDAKADGTIFSRGAGVVLLKRYKDALRDGDNIHGVILSGAINNDGSNKVGFTAPGVEGQVSVALEALEIADIDPSTISYVEAHGTATSLGDPIEVTSLTEVFRTYTDKKQFCAIGSVKTNIGHTDSASGVAGLMKTILALKHKKIPAHLNFTEENPKINFAESPFYVNTETSVWEASEVSKRRALINSFGVGGTNACVIVEEPPVQKTEENEDQKVMMLSAKSREALEEYQENFNDFISKKSDLNLSDLAYTLQTGRKKFEHRAFFPFTQKDDLLSALSTDSTNYGYCTEDEKSMIFMFPGQGNQYPNMGRDLYNSNSTYRETFDYCCDYLKKTIALDIKEFIFAEEGTEKARIALKQTYITQPAIFIVSYAMAMSLKEKGIVPEVLIGHSVGEYVAACVSGIMKLEDALYLVAQRGALVQALPGGSMLAVLENEDKILPLLFPGVEVAAVNNQNLTVLAGSDEKIEELMSILDNVGYFYKPLDTSHAFHSAMMEPCLADFAHLFDTIELQAPQVPIVSTVTGTYLKPEEAMDPNYWVRHVRESVRFSDAVSLCLDMNPALFIEVGPGLSLESSVKRDLPKETLHEVVRTMPAAKESYNSSDFFTEAIGNIWLNGGKIDWEAYYRDENRVTVSLPVYPFQREAYSIDFSQSDFGTPAEEINVRHESTDDWYSVPTWKRTANIPLIEKSATEPKNWLLFEDSFGLHKDVKEQLQQMGHTFISVSWGAAYKKTAVSQYEVALDKREDFEELVRDIKGEGSAIDNVLFLTNYKEKEHALNSETFSTIENEAFFSILYMIQSLYGSNDLKENHIGVVANGVFEVVGGEVVAPERALGVGTCRVLIQEFPKARATFIDVDVVASSKRAALAENIISEVLSNSYDAVVAYRNNFRWIEQFDRIAMKENSTPTYRDGGVYLVTGGLGGIGLLTAKTIAEEVKATLVLTYNSPIPSKETWEEWLRDNHEDSFLREKILGVLELEEMGAEVLLYQANVSNFDSMLAMKEDVERKVGPINGVIHSAGSVGGGVIPLKSAESVRPVFDSKFRGTVVLDKIFQGQELDFMLLYSSITSILGEATRLDYCSANAFLDAFASYRNSIQNSCTTAINWAGWESIGMAVRWEKEKTKKSTKTRLRHSHEFLKLITKDDTQQIYEVTFSPEDDWIINSHFIVGHPTVVGTSFLEIIHQYAKSEFGGRTIEMKNLFFISPLMFEKGKYKRIRFMVDLKNGKFKFAFRTQLLDKDPDTDFWHDHFIGEIVVGDYTPQPLDLAAMKEKLKGEVETSKSSRLVLGANDEPLIDLGERWDIDNEINVGSSEWLAKLTLREEFAGDTEFFDYHPAMMDKATSFGLRFVSDNPFLPFSYKSVKPYKPMPSTVYAYATASSSGDRDDAVSIDITLISPEGEVLMEIEQYTMKQVNQSASESLPKDAKEEDAVFTEEIDYIHPTEGKKVIKQILSSRHVSQLIVYPCDFEFMVKDTVPDLKKREEEKEKKQNEKKSYYARPALSTEYEEPESEMEKTITNIWQDILGLDKIGRNDTFTELGGNSLLAIQTIANIVDVLGVELTAQVFYDNPTVKGLSEAVVNSIMDLSDMDNIEELLVSLEEE